MPQNRKTYKFSELYDISSGLSKSRDQFGHGFPFVTFKNVFYNFFLPDELGDLANTTEKERASGSVRRGDVFLTRTSETLHELGMSSVALKDYPNATFNGFCKRLRLKKEAPLQVDPVFIGYYLRSQNFRNEVTKHATMTTRASLNSTSINTLEVKLPPFEEQQRIGAILKPLDDKIELNLATNCTLEQMAMALYKHWFVDFGPFQGGNFIESELGLIPEGWEVKLLDEVVELIIDHRGKTPKKLGGDWSEEAEGNFQAISAKNIKSGKIVKPDTIKYLGKTLFRKWMKDPLQDRDILLTSEAPIGEYYLILNKTDYCLSQRLFGIRSDQKVLRPELLYCFLSSNSGQQQLLGRGSGSTVQGIKQSELRRLKVIVPELEVQNEVADTLLNYYQIMRNNDEEVESLTTLRDTLLPKLISGAVRVKDSERTVAHAL